MERLGAQSAGVEDGAAVVMLELQSMTDILPTAKPTYTKLPEAPRCSNNPLFTELSAYHCVPRVQLPESIWIY